MAEVICLSSDDEEEIVFSTFNVEVDEKSIPERFPIQEVYLVGQDPHVPTEYEKDPLDTGDENGTTSELQENVDERVNMEVENEDKGVDNKTEELGKLEGENGKCVEVSENSESSVPNSETNSGTNNKTILLIDVPQDELSPDTRSSLETRDTAVDESSVETVDSIRNEDSNVQYKICSLEGGEKSTQEPNQTEKSSKLKLLAEQLAKALKQNEMTKADIVVEDVTTQTTMTASINTEVEPTKSDNIVEGVVKKRRGRPPLKKPNCEEPHSESKKFPPRMDLRKRDAQNYQEEDEIIWNSSSGSSDDPEGQLRTKRKTRRKRCPNQKQSKSPVQSQKECQITTEVKDNILFYPQGTTNLMLPQQEPLDTESSNILCNLQSTSTVQDVILKVSLGEFSRSEYDNGAIRKKIENKKAIKRAHRDDESATPSKQLRVDPNRSENCTSGDLIKIGHSVVDTENTSNDNIHSVEQNTVQNVINSVVEQQIIQNVNVTKVANLSKKSIIMNKYINSDDRLKSPKQTDRCEFANQEIPSTPDQDKINKLKFTFDRRNGGVSVSIVSPPQISPEAQEGNSSSEKETRTVASGVVGMAELKSQTRPPAEVETPVETVASKTLNTSNFSIEPTNLMRHKANFIECYKIVFDESGESMCNGMGKMILATMKAHADKVKYHAIATKNGNCDENVKSVYTNARSRYINIYNQVQPQIENLFRLFCYKIFKVPHREQRNLLLLAWFVKVFMYISTECEEYADQMLQTKRYVYHFLPKTFNFEQQSSVQQVFRTSDEEFEKHCFLVIEYMEDCYDSDDDALVNIEGKGQPDKSQQSSDSGNNVSQVKDTRDPTSLRSDNSGDSVKESVRNTKELNNVSQIPRNELSSVIKVDNSDIPVSINEPCTSSSTDSSQGNNGGFLLQVLVPNPKEIVKNNPGNVSVPLFQTIKHNPHVSVIQATNSVSQMPATVISQDCRLETNQQTENLVGSKLNITNRKVESTEKSNHLTSVDKRPIMVKSPLTINRDHEKSLNRYSLPAFEDSFKHRVKTDLLSQHMNTTGQKQTFLLQNRTQDAYRDPNRRRNTCSELVNNLRNSQAMQNNDELKTTLRNQHSSNQSTMMPNHQSHVKPTRRTSDEAGYSTTSNPSQMLYNHLVRGQAEIATTNPKYTSTSQGNAPQASLLKSRNFIDNKTLSTLTRTAYPHVNQPLPTIQNSEIEKEIQRYVAESTQAQNPQYYETSTHLPVSYDQGMQPGASKYIQRMWLRQQYLWANRRTQNPQYHQYDTTATGQPNFYEQSLSNAVVTTGPQKSKPHQPPPPYPGAVPQHQQQQSFTTTQTKQTTGYMNQASNDHFNTSRSKHVQNWPSTNHSADLAVPNRTVLDVPADANVTINNFNITTYVPPTPDCNYDYVPQNYNNLHSFNHVQTSEQQLTKPSS